MVLPQDDPTRRLATEATIPPLVAASIANDPTVANSAATMAQNTAGLVPVWKASTAYVTGQRVIAPDGDIVSSKANFTSGATYSAPNWTTSQHTVTIDNTVGRRAFAWDIGNNRTQMIYGDTGSRLVTSTLANGAALNLSIRRIGNRVDVTLRQWTHTAATAVIYSFPTGFKPDQTPRIGFIGYSASPNEIAVLQIVAGDLHQLTAHTDGVWAQFSFTTNDAWPATLPGTAVGTPQ